MELEARAAFERLDAQVDFAELASAARLLLVAGMAFGRRGNGLAVRNARRAGDDFKLEVDLHAVEDRTDVHFGQAADHGLVEHGVMVDGHRRILLRTSPMRASSPRRDGAIARPNIGFGKLIGRMRTSQRFGSE